MKSTMQAVTVFCASNTGSEGAYALAAKALACALCEFDLGLVYGGASVGLMGVLSDAMLELSGKVTGVIPLTLLKAEVVHNGLSELVVVDSLSERKDMMAKLGDAFLLLPGGLGSLDEFFGVWTGLQLGIHAKPCGILNVNGYFDSLLEFIDRAIEKGFVNAEMVGRLVVRNDAKSLVERMVNEDVAVS